jgi:hypothetical protein
MCQLGDVVVAGLRRMQSDGEVLQPPDPASVVDEPPLGDEGDVANILDIDHVTGGYRRARTVPP